MTPALPSLEHPPLAGGHVIYINCRFALTCTVHTRIAQFFVERYLNRGYKPVNMNRSYKYSLFFVGTVCNVLNACSHVSGGWLYLIRGCMKICTYHRDSDRCCVSLEDRDFLTNIHEASSSLADVVISFLMAHDIPNDLGNNE